MNDNSQFPFRSMSSHPNVYAYRARHLLSQFQARNADIPKTKLADLREELQNLPPTADLPVAIIGAGMAGLYTAMIFESLKIPYQIIDADTPERVGGRVFTHYFSDKEGSYDYFVGRICTR